MTFSKRNIYPSVQIYFDTHALFIYPSLPCWHTLHIAYRHVTYQHITPQHITYWCISTSAIDISHIAYQPSAHRILTWLRICAYMYMLCLFGRVHRFIFLRYAVLFHRFRLLSRAHILVLRTLPTKLDIFCRALPFLRNSTVPWRP